MLPEDYSGARWCGIRLGRHPTAVRRGVSGFRVAKHLHLPVTLDKQAETAGRKRDDAHVGKRTERFWDGLIRRRVVLLSTAGELDVAVDRDDATDATQSEAVVRIRRLPLLGYGKLSACQYEPLPSLLHIPEHAQIRLQIISGRGLDVGVSELSRDHADVGSGLDRQRAERVTQVAWRHAGQFHAPAPTAVVVRHLVRVQTADQSSGLRAVA